ncbi:DUF4167 domain-containing protein [Aestuariibius sp. 2305UL40-4]|uniref:DUF4167 domain-containing protein n=1 Tax=Aestuariibius violaceus TaxID=3234132 RepID=UPI00345EA0C3
MRSSKSRSRGKNRNNNRPSGNIVNRVFDSSGPEGKVRGTPQQIIDKYNQLHRDAVLSGDRVDAENFAQHAEHYTRMLAEAQREMEARREEQDRQRQAEREKQAERDRERQAERDRQQAEGGGDRPSDQPRERQPDQPRERQREKTTSEADVIDTGGAEDTGLVETPEEKPRRRRSRKPRPENAAQDAGDETSPPQAAE